MIDDSRIKHAIPSWFRLLGWIVFAGSALLVLRLIYEETILTWQNGPQMLLFSIAHIHGTFLAVGGLATLLVYVWFASFPGLATHGMLRKRHIGAAAWVQCGVLMFLRFLLYVPYHPWQWFTLEVAGPGPHAATQMGYAVGGNHHYLVRAFLDKDLAVDSPGEDSKTALDIACTSESP